MLRNELPFFASLLFAAAFVAAPTAFAQNLNLEGQTGGFITPTAYVAPVAPHKHFSVPELGYHFVAAGSVIGNVQTVSITEGIGNHLEFGYTRSIHTNGSNPDFSTLWNYSGMNIFHGKTILLKENAFHRKWMPGLGAGFVVRTGDHFVSGAIANTSYNNEDVYIAATKTALNLKVPLLINVGFKMTNAVLFGLGGQSTRFGGRWFGGIGFPLPGPWHTAIVPAAGFTQEPYHVKNLNQEIPGGGRIPTTLDYAVRWTQRQNARFSIDFGIGQVAGNIGSTTIPTTSSLVVVPVNLQARHVIGFGGTYRF